ncbi:mitochondrial protein C2orf69 homolog [Diadema antillarum]|uniref:mitochondrial protein C2orf69 homolog n=1 Tax=Diadema antillarum TaxID=105358 RepID=UPI003A852A5B
MKHHPFNKMWQTWTFENTMGILRKRFPHSHVIMVTPSRRVEEAFSCFQNFMEVDATGSPVNYDHHNAWEHLKLLLDAAWRRIDKESGSSEVESANIYGPAEQHSPRGDSPLTLIGFSKGCTVLNQLVVELPEASTNPDLIAFISRVKHFYWLDGGHSGTVSTYVTDDSGLKELAKLKATIHVHVTPYQVKDEGRPHIGEDHQSFLMSLLHYGGNVQRKLHFPEERRSLKRHFEVLKVF